MSAGARSFLLIVSPSSDLECFSSVPCSVLVPRGCQMSVMTKRLQDPEPPMGPDGSLAAAGGLYFAGEATSTLDSQQVHGAMKSGDLVAECIVKRIKRHMQRQS